METNFFPTITKEKNLPFYITCIGENDRQCDIIRKTGYYNPQIFISTKGKGILKAEQNQWEISENQAFFLPRDLPHEYYPITDSWFTHYVSFDGYSTEILLKELGLDKPLIFNLNSDNLEHIFRKMLNSIKSNKMTSKMHAASYLYTYIMEFYLLSIDERTENPDSKLDKIKDYININYSKDITLEELSVLLDVSPQYLCRIFKKATGLRPIEYINEVRIQHAKNLLLNSSLSIKEIANTIGFSDPGYFSTVFKKTEGISPREYLIKK